MNISKPKYYSRKIIHVYGKFKIVVLYDKLLYREKHKRSCMKNCDGSPDILRADILNIVEHYKVSATLMVQVQYDVLVFVGQT